MRESTERKHRIIFHIDMDAFFAAIEERENPRFQGKPVVVCTSTPFSVHPLETLTLVYDGNNREKDAYPELVEGWSSDPQGGFGRGVVSTANYEARKFGIRSALPISEAYRRCPQAIFLPVNGKLYGTVSREIMAILRTYSPQCEEVSVDEAYLDMSHIPSYAEAKRYALTLKRHILQVTRLTASVGIGPNKLIAKIASDYQKPDGLTIVTPARAQAFLDPMPVATLWGIGVKSAGRLWRLGIHRIRDLRMQSEERLSALFGVRGHEMYGRARGVDMRPVTLAYPVKSMGREYTFNEDTRDAERIFSTLRRLCERVFREARDERFRGRTVTIVVRYAGFETHTKAKTLPKPVRSLREFSTLAVRLALPFLLNGRNIRLIGVRLSGANRKSRIAYGK